MPWYSHFMFFLLLCLMSPPCRLTSTFRFGVNATFVATHWRKLLKRSKRDEKTD